MHRPRETFEKVFPGILSSECFLLISKIIHLAVPHLGSGQLGARGMAQMVMDPPLQRAKVFVIISLTIGCSELLSICNGVFTP